MLLELLKMIIYFTIGWIIGPLIVTLIKKRKSNKKYRRLINYYYEPRYYIHSTYKENPLASNESINEGDNIDKNI